MANCILFVSPSPEEARTFSLMLGAVPATIHHAPGLKQAADLLEKETVAAIVTEARLPDGNWNDMVRMVRQSGKRIPVVVTDRFADGGFWIEVLDAGAYDLLPQPFHQGEVERILAGAMTAPPPFRKVAPAA